MKIIEIEMDEYKILKPNLFDLNDKQIFPK
jgi:hypothetical protein